MATTDPEQKRKRLALTLNEETWRVLEAYAEVQGRPVATATRHLLEEIAPMLHDVTGAAKQAQEAPEKARNDLLEYIAEAQHRASQVQMDLIQMGKTKSRGKKR